MHDNEHTTGTPRRTRRPWARRGRPHRARRRAARRATAAFAAAPGNTRHLGYGPAIKLVVTNPKPGDIAGAGGDFTVDLKPTALNATGNQELSAAQGYRARAEPPPSGDVRPRKA